FCIFDLHVSRGPSGIFILSLSSGLSASLTIAFVSLYFGFFKKVDCRRRRGTSQLKAKTTRLLEPKAIVDEGEEEGDSLRIVEMETDQDEEPSVPQHFMPQSFIPQPFVGVDVKLSKKK
ncbi:hypothetical protein Dimus_017635, partial [Dionaea muscipula]